MNQEIRYDEAIFNNSVAELKAEIGDFEADIVRMSDAFSALLSEWNGNATASLEQAGKSLLVSSVSQIEKTRELCNGVIFGHAENVARDQMLGTVFGESSGG